MSFFSCFPSSAQPSLPRRLHEFVPDRSESQKLPHENIFSNRSCWVITVLPGDSCQPLHTAGFGNAPRSYFYREKKNLQYNPLMLSEYCWAVLLSCSYIPIAEQSCSSWCRTLKHSVWRNLDNATSILVQLHKSLKLGHKLYNLARKQQI